MERLKSIRDSIAKDSPFQSGRVVRLVREAVARLRQYPEFGAVVTEYGNDDIRELRVFYYRIIYHVRKTAFES